MNLNPLRRLFEIDTRTLAIFRFALGFLCLIDTLRRLPYLNLLYTNEGLLSNHFALFAAPYPMFSLLFSFSTPAEVWIFFLAGIVISISFAFGYKTRTSAFLLLVFVMSVTNRNTLLIYGADTVKLNLLVFSQFLPLGACWSLDAKNRGKNEYYKFSSLITALLFFQLAVLYLFASIQKNGTTWRDGYGLYYALHQDRVVTGLGVWVRNNAPIGFLRIASDTALYIELLATFFILTPIKTVSFRRFGFFALVLFHISIGSLLNLGLFPIAMFVHLLILISDKELSYITKRLNLSDDLPSESIPRCNSCLGLRKLAACGASLAVAFIFVTHVIEGNWIFRGLTSYRAPLWVQSVANYTSFRQSWSMFAPDAPDHDFQTIWVGELDNGEKIDLLRGIPAEIKPVAHGDKHWNQLLDAVNGMLVFEKGIVSPVEIERWVRERRGGMKLPRDRILKRFEIIKVNDRSPKFSEDRYKKYDVETTSLLKFELG